MKKSISFGIIAFLIFSLVLSIVSAENTIQVTVDKMNPELTDNVVCYVSGSANGNNVLDYDNYIIFRLEKSNGARVGDYQTSAGVSNGRLYTTFDLDQMGAREKDKLYCKVYYDTNIETLLGRSQMILVQAGSGASSSNPLTNKIELLPVIPTNNDDLKCIVNGYDETYANWMHFKWEFKNKGDRDFQRFINPACDFVLNGEVVCLDETDGDGRISSTVSKAYTSPEQTWRCTGYYDVGISISIGYKERIIQPNTPASIDFSTVPQPFAMVEDTSISINISPYVSNPENRALEISASSVHFTSTIDSVMNATLTPSQDWNGIEDVIFYIDDKNTGIRTAALRVNVAAVNDAPVISGFPNPITIMSGKNTTLSLDNYANDVDNADNQLVWTATGNTNIAITIDAATRTVFIKPNAGFSGSENVAFRVSDPGGLFDSFVTTIVALSDNAPVVVITRPADNSTFTQGNNITFTATATDLEDGALSTVDWASSINGAFSNGLSISYGSLSAGTHTITAIARDSQGVQGTASITVNIAPLIVPSNDPLVLTANPAIGIAPLKVTFTATPNGRIPVNYVWDFGDGSTAIGNGNVMTHTYLYPQNFQARVTGFYSDGSSTSATAAVIVSLGNIKPVITIKASPASGAAPLEVKFTSTAYGNSPFAYEWDFDSDGVVDSTETDPEYTYEYTGTYTAKLTVTDIDGDKTSATLSISTKDIENDLYVGEITLVGGEFVPAGDVLPVIINLDNEGNVKQKQLKMAVSIDDLGIRQTEGPFDLKIGEQTSKRVYLDIPADARGQYDIKITLSNDNLFRAKYRTIQIQ